MEKARIHELFAEIAVAQPGAVAIICGDAQLSYRALAERADKLGQELAQPARAWATSLHFAPPRHRCRVCHAGGAEVRLRLSGARPASS